MKRTPIPRRRAPLRRSAWVRRATQVAHHRPRRRSTGPSLATRLVVAQRAGYRCERCGATLLAIAEIHHRHPRRMGGTRRAWINSPSNLLWLCGDCHRWVERHRSAAYDAGWLVHEGTHPHAVPVELHGIGKARLTHDGGYLEAV